MTAIVIDNVAAFGVEEIDSDSAEQVAGRGPYEFVEALLAQAAYELISDPGAAARAFMRGFTATAS
jgi:hypothetical protein